jgi:excisionase family DNA binding protein
MNAKARLLRLKPGRGSDDFRNESAKPLGSSPLMMTVDEVAEALGISTRQVWRLRSKGDIPEPLNIRRNVRWRRSDLLRWIEGGCPAAEG